LKCLQWENCPSQKQDLKRKLLVKFLGKYRGLVLGWRPGGQARKVAPIISHMLFRFLIDFMVVVVGHVSYSGY
jgi:hypothetical protein